MLRIPAPTAQDRANQWSDAYDAAEALFAKAFKDCPQLICSLFVRASKDSPQLNQTETSLDVVCKTIAARQAIPFQIITAAVLTAAKDLHEQHHNRV